MPFKLKLQNLRWPHECWRQGNPNVLGRSLRYNAYKGKPSTNGKRPKSIEATPNVKSRATTISRHQVRIDKERLAEPIRWIRPSDDATSCNWK